MKKLMFIVLILFTSSVILADEIVTTSDGKKVLLKTNGKWEYVIADANTIKYAEEAFAVWDTTFDRRTENKYNDIVRLFFHYQNLTEKTIIGVQVYVEIFDTFGNLLFNNSIEDEVIIKPKQKLNNKDYKYWKNNPFIDDEPFDYMWPSAQNGTAKIKCKILKVIFEDGTILKAKGL